MNPKAIIGAAVLFVLMSMLSWALLERNGRMKVQADYDGFVAKAQVLAAQQLEANARKEKEYAEKLRMAESARSAAVIKLREYQAGARSNRVSVTPATATDNLCFSRAKFDTAIQSFLEEVEGLLATGDLALIDNHSLIEAWPK